MTLHVDDDDLGRVIGRKGSTAQSLRVLLRALGSKNEAHYNLRIADNKDRGSADSRTDNVSLPVENEPPPAKTAEDSLANNNELSDFAQTNNQEPEEIEKKEDDSLVDKTKKEFEDLDDLDI